MLEFVSNLVIFIVVQLGIESKPVTISMMWLDTIVCFVLIPSTYIANTEVSKAYFLASAWYTSFIDRFRSNNANPDLNERI